MLITRVHVEKIGRINLLSSDIHPIGALLLYSSLETTSANVVGATDREWIGFTIVDREGITDHSSSIVE